MSETGAVPSVEQLLARLATLEAALRQAEADRDAARRWGFLEVKKEFAPGGNVITGEEEQERAALQARAEAECWGESTPPASRIGDEVPGLVLGTFEGKPVKARYL